jgi:hypothetical protein
MTFGPQAAVGKNRFIDKIWTPNANFLPLKTSAYF